MNSRHLPIPAFLVFIILSPSSLISQSLVRTSYQFTQGRAYSAVAQIPSFDIVDLGKEVQPIAVTDGPCVLIDTAEQELVRWRGGQREVLAESLFGLVRADMNQANSVALFLNNEEGIPEVHFWNGLESDPGLRSVPSAHGHPPYMSFPYAFTDFNDLVIYTESESSPVFAPPHTATVHTTLLDLDDASHTHLSTYRYQLHPDYSLTQEGRQYSVADMNNYGHSVGFLYEDSVYTPPYSEERDVKFEYEYYTFNGEFELGFEPLQVNDMVTVVGRTEGPSIGLVVLDQFGERVIAGNLPELESNTPLLTNPKDGFEAIVVENHYFIRMSERDLSGRPNGQPAPDFWQGTLEDVIIDSTGWSDLKATCVSDNGLVSGIGHRVDPATGTAVEHGFLLLPRIMVADVNRDGTIDAADRRLVSPEFPFRWWINDDDDSPDTFDAGESDLPEQSGADSLNDTVDGLRDLVDFFPLQLDLRSLLKVIPDKDALTIRLRHEDGAFNLLYAALKPQEVGILSRESPGERFGPDLNQPAATADVLRITPEGTELRRSYLDRLLNTGEGVLLIEARAASTAPLILEVESDDEIVLESSFPLSVAPVRDMFRILNLRACHPKFQDADPGPWLTSLGDPPNLPDQDLLRFKSRLPTVINIHGFNWSGDAVPAAHAEVFKRFYQMGSHGRFIGLSWRADQGILELLDTSFDYNENVINAWISAEYLARSLSAFAGPMTTLFAHSLGNLVASSAVADFGFEAARYIMLNSAVPVEAYLGDQSDRRLMVHPQWKNNGAPNNDYGEHLLAANWSSLFPGDDPRAALSWKNRFAGLGTLARCTQFYSSGEDILRPGNGDLPNLISEVWAREEVWTYNEMVKGTSSLGASLTADRHGGWDFNREYMRWVDPGGPAHPPPGSWVPMTIANAASIDPAALISEPFFRPFSGGDRDFPLWGDGSWLYGDLDSVRPHLPQHPYATTDLEAFMNHAKILAEAIPAHSAAAGARSLDGMSLVTNVDMDASYRDPAFWPDRGDADKRDRWLHSDYLNLPLPHVARLYQSCIEIINTIQ